MSDQRTSATRRRFLGAGLGAAVAGVLAGCTGSSGDSGESSVDGGNRSASGAGGGTNGSTVSSGGTTTTGGGENSYSVTMSPVGEVEFTDVPRSLMVYSLLYADMAVAYGHGGAVNSLGFDAEAGGNTLDAYYARLDGVSFDRQGLTQLNTGSEGAVDRDVDGA